MAGKQITRNEISQHNKKGDLWVVIDSKVYDLSKFAPIHPGGHSVLLDPDIAGQDATEAFFGLHRYEVLQKPQYSRLQIGVVGGEEQQIQPRKPGEASEVPYAEPTWLTRGYYTPYFNDSHRRCQKAFRKFVEEVIFPDAEACEESGKRPAKHVLDEFARLNITAINLGVGKHLQGRVLLDGAVTPDEFDIFHELIVIQEYGRVNVFAHGYHEGLCGGNFIGLPAIANFARPEIKDRVVAEVLDGKKLVSLAISEAFAGSDVSGLKCTATKSADGTHWIVNGTKKWITGGMMADYFVVGCRTNKGIVVLLVERGEGVETKPIKTAYSSAAGTAFVTFDEVRVPVEHTLGPDNGNGLSVILSNFNHERWMMACSVIGAHRLIVEECLLWASQRKVFGKPLTSQAVVRSKLASMIARVEAGQSWLESVTYQMKNMSYEEQSSKMAGPIAFLKMYSTQAAQKTAADAIQIFGGRGITRTGMGRYIEHFHKTVPFDAILGGAEDVLGDLGVRQAMKNMPRTRL